MKSSIKYLHWIHITDSSVKGMEKSFAAVNGAKHITSTTEKFEAAEVG